MSEAQSEPQVLAFVHPSPADEEKPAHVTPEIECIYARWVKARADGLAAEAVDAPINSDMSAAANDAAAEASARADRECWAMVGTPAKQIRHVRFKIEMFRDQYEPGGERYDGLELALINSIDADLVALR